MANDRGDLEHVIGEIREHQAKGEVAEFSVDATAATTRINLRAVGEDAWLWRLKERSKHVGGLDLRPLAFQKQAYYFLSQELRPGSGVIRVSGGRAEGPGGTLTCLLSSRDAQDIYFAAAGHVLSDFWKSDIPDQEGSVYLNRRGFFSTPSRRFLGKLLKLSPRPERVPFAPSLGGLHFGLPRKPFIDIGLVKLEGDFDWRQRTTCYGSFGEWAENRDEEIPRTRPLGGDDEETHLEVPDRDRFKIIKNRVVTKCGAEEKHFTDAVIDDCSTTVTVYGPEGEKFQLHGQVILRELSSPMTPDSQTHCRYTASENRDKQEDNEGDKECHKRPTIPFAVPGDSGTMVVYKESKRPLGMLIAGSILDGRYVVTPFNALEKFWEAEDFVLLRG